MLASGPCIFVRGLSDGEVVGGEDDGGSSVLCKAAEAQHNTLLTFLQHSSTNTHTQLSYCKRALSVTPCSNSHGARASTDLNLGDHAAHHAHQDACCPAPGSPSVHTRTGRCSRERMACRTREADGSTLQLSWPKRHAHVGAGRPRLLVLDSVAAGQMQARGGGLDDVEWGVDLVKLEKRDAHVPAEEEVVIVEQG